MKEQEYNYQPEPKICEGEILPPLPKPALRQDRVRESVQVQERLLVIRSELTHYIEKPTPPPRVIVVERQTPPQSETVWEEIGEGIGEGIAAVRGFCGEMAPIWRGLRR